MMSNKKLICGALLAVLLTLPPAHAAAPDGGDGCCSPKATAQNAPGAGQGTGSAGGAHMPVVMPEPGEKVRIKDGFYFLYGFDQKPKLGPAILKVQLFTGDGKQDSSLEIKGAADMPAMRGMHATGVQPFKLNKKGDYLLPLMIVMPGEWEIVISVFREGKLVYEGSRRFKV